MAQKKKGFSFAEISSVEDPDDIFYGDGAKASEKAPTDPMENSEMKKVSAEESPADPTEEKNTIPAGYHRNYDPSIPQEFIETKQRYNFMLKPKVKKKLEEISKKNNKSASEMLEIIITSYKG